MILHGCASRKQKNIWFYITTPIFIYNFENFWDPLVELIEHMIKNNFAGENMKEAYKVIKNHSELEKELRIREEN